MARRHSRSVPLSGTALAKSAVGNIFLFSTKSYDFDFALYHYGARWYDPGTGRFISPDPLGFVDGPNPYLYVAGDPVQFIDPWGLCSQHGTWRDRLAVALAALRGTGQGVGEIVQGLYPSTVGNILDLAHGAGANLGFADASYEPQGAMAAWVARAYDPRIRWYHKIPIGGPIGQAWGTDTWAFLEHPGILTGLRFTRDTAAVGSTALSGASLARAVGVPGTYQEAATVVAPKSGTEEMITVRSYTDAAGREGISNSGHLRADSWVTLPEEIPSRAGHLQIEEILEIQPGRGSHYLELEVPASNLRVPANGPRTSGGSLQFQLNEPVPIDPSTFRRPPGRPVGN